MATSDQLDPDQRTASQIIRAQLQQWGLGSLAGKLNDLIREGMNADAITLELQATKEYKTRFAANDARIKNGLAALSPAEYVAAENSYRRVLQSFGLPASFWDGQDDFRKFLENDVSPQEVNDRAQTAQQVWLTSDTGVRQVWKDFYGLTDGAAIAQILDPGTAEPIINRMATAAQIGNVARQNGLQADRSRFEQLADQGVTTDQARQGFTEIGQTLPTLQGIAGRFGTSFTQAEAEGAKITGLASAQRKQQQLVASEQALFDAHSAVDAKTLNNRTTGRY